MVGVESGLNHLSVIGGGCSVKSVDLTKVPGYVLAVNDSAVYAPRVDAVISMDRLWTEYRWDKLKEMDRPTWIRRSALKNAWHKGAEGWKNLSVFDNALRDDILSDKIGELNGNNSGACALNLVYQLRPQHAWIFGYDMRKAPGGKPYWYPAYPWNAKGATKPGHYVDWSKQMERYVKQLQGVGISVTVVTDHIWAKGVPIITPDEFRRTKL